MSFFLLSFFIGQVQAAEVPPEEGTSASQCPISEPLSVTDRESVRRTHDTPPTSSQEFQRSKNRGRNKTGHQIHVPVVLTLAGIAGQPEIDELGLVHAEVRGEFGEVVVLFVHDSSSLQGYYLWRLVRGDVVAGAVEHADLALVVRLDTTSLVVTRSTVLARVLVETRLTVPTDTVTFRAAFLDEDLVIHDCYIKPAPLIGMSPILPSCVKSGGSCMKPMTL